MNLSEMKNGNLSNHILYVSATMVGVCMTMLSITKLTPASVAISRWVDDLLILDSVLFLSSTVLSYWALRHENTADKFENIADWIFIIGLVLLVITGFGIATLEFTRK